MSKSPALFNLIKSLSQSEKRYFKRYANIHSNDISDKKYMQIFDEIEKLDDYDGLLVMRKMGWDSSKKGHYSEKKNYLYNLILKSLRAYHMDKKVLYELRGYQTDINILLEKGLREEALKRLRKAKKLADKYHYDEIALELSLVERTISRRIATQNLEEIVKEKRLICNQYLNQINSKYELLSCYEPLLLMSKNINGNGDLDEFYKNAQKTYRDSDKSYHSEYYYHLSAAFYYRATGNAEKSYLGWKKLINMMAKESYLIDEDTFRYIGMLNNYLAYCRALGKHQERKDYVRNFEKISDKKLDHTSRVLFFQSYYLSEINYLVGKEAYDKVIELVPAIIKGLKKYGKNLNASLKMTLYFNVCYTYLSLDKYEDAHQWCNNILMMKSDVREDIQIGARLIEILLHYQFENYTLIESLNRSAKTYFKKKNALTEYHKLVLSYFLKAANTMPSKRKEVLSEFYWQLKRSEKSYTENIFFDSSIFWLKKKI